MITQTKSTGLYGMVTLKLIGRIKTPCSRSMLQNIAHFGFSQVDSVQCYDDTFLEVFLATSDVNEGWYDSVGKGCLINNIREKIGQEPVTQLPICASSTDEDVLRFMLNGASH